MSLKCVALKCRERIPLDKLMCRKHWRMVPSDIKDLVVENYAIGQVSSGKMSAGFRRAVVKAVKAVAIKEGAALSPVEE